MSKETTTKSLAIVNKQISNELVDPNIVRTLLATTFKNFDEKLMRQAIFEGVIRGFDFRDFLQKDVYAIKYKDTYTLVTSISHARKIGMRSGVVGKSAPTFEVDKNGKVAACTITIKRRVGKDIGEYTATVYMDEYYVAGKNGYPSLWDSKPRTMLAKVAEMHALRMACPEEMSQVYTEEEFDKEKGDEYDNEEIKDDVVVVSTGDDTQGIEPANEKVIPESETERRILILKELKRLDPSRDLADEKEVERMVGDLTELAFVPKNYGNIIHLLARK